MKTRSFRLKITLTSTLLSGICLCLFGAWAWTSIYNIRLHRIDREIKGLGHRHLSDYHKQWGWEGFENALGFIFGENKQEPFILFVRDSEGNVLHQSKNWPLALNPDKFSDPTEILEKLPENRPVRRRPHPPGPGYGPPSPEDLFETEPRLSQPAFVLSPDFYTEILGTQYFRIGVMGSERVILILGFNLEDFHADMRQLRTVFMIALPVVLLIIALASWLLSQRALRPIHRVAKTARQISAKGLHQRIPQQSEDMEFEELVTVLNQMLDRLEGSFQQAMRFSADAAHELKTPLTILQGELAQALQSTKDGSDEQRTIHGLMNEVQRLKAIIQKLLLLSLSDAGQLKIKHEKLNLTELLEEIAEDLSILAPELTIETDLSPNVKLNGDADLIRQVLQNLTTNAMKYNCKKGSIILRLEQKNTTAHFTILNTGDPISEEDYDKIFLRFYRTDKSRSRHIDGVGLGLSLSREIARAHGGNLVIDTPTEGMVSFSLILPTI